MNSALVRKSNIELLRIVSMFLVMIHHANFPALGIPTQEQFSVEPVWISFRTLVESMSLVCVNLFVLISGWCGIKFKAKGVFNLVFTAAFYLWIISLLMVLINKIWGGIDLTPLRLCPFPLMGSNWFVLQYLVMYVISPMLNNFEESVSKKYFRNFLLFAFGINIYVGYIWHNYPFGNGYNFILMASIYLLGRYMKRYYEEIIMRISTNKLLAGYLLSSILFAVFMYFWYIRSSHQWPFLYAYNNPLILFSSVCVFCVFIKMDFQSRIINSLATSCLAILLIHTHPVGGFYIRLAQTINENSHLLAIFLIVAFIAIIMVASFFVDKVRIAWQNYLSTFFFKNGTKIFGD